MAVAIPLATARRKRGRIAAAAFPDELRKGDLLQRVYMGGAAPSRSVNAPEEKV